MGNSGSEPALNRATVNGDADAHQTQTTLAMVGGDPYENYETPPVPDADIERQAVVPNENKNETRVAPDYQHSLSASLHRVEIGPPIPVTYVATKTPKDTLKAVYKAGIYKAGLTLDLLCIQSFMAGFYIAMASHLFLAVGGGVLGACFFPTGLIAVVLTSAELFTGDSLVFIASVLGGKVHFKYLVRNWTVSWIMNFAGCMAWSLILSYGSTALQDVGAEELAVHVALKKANQPWWSIFAKGIGANFCVCVGVWQATCAEETAGKILALWFPVTGFVIMGFDHAIANQFLIPTGMLYGADISVFHLFFKALLPATLGNIVGGGIFVGAVYWYVFDSMTSGIQLFSRIRFGWQKPHSTFHRHRYADAQSSNSSGHLAVEEDGDKASNDSNGGARSLPADTRVTRRKGTAMDPRSV